MLIDELKSLTRENGVVGAGGAGFPSYAKMTENADTIILNCVECEPLLKLHRQLLETKADKIISMLDEVRSILGAKEAVIGIKDEYRNTIDAVKAVINDYPKLRICEVKAAYPMGDEVVLIYEATGRVIKPGGIPKDENVIVYNVETMYNLYMALHNKKPVTHKLVSIVGEVKKPVTVFIPIGTSVMDALKYAGGAAISDAAYVMGGPMMGFVGNDNTLIGKTTNAVIVLPYNHKIIAGMNKNLGIERKRASSSCCQCRTCTDLCPRHSLGHPIEPHRIMRAVANQDTTDLSVFKNAAFCSGCGVCEKYACPQGLSPRSIIAQFKGGLKAAGIVTESINPGNVDTERDYKKVPTHRLKDKLDLARYDTDAPVSEDNTYSPGRVVISLRQHIGAPAKACVSLNTHVKCGDMIAEAADGLSVSYHASIDGKIMSISDNEIVIAAE